MASVYGCKVALSKNLWDNSGRENADWVSCNPVSCQQLFVQWNSEQSLLGHRCFSISCKLKILASGQDDNHCE